MTASCSVFSRRSFKKHATFLDDSKHIEKKIDEFFFLKCFKLSIGNHNVTKKYQTDVDITKSKFVYNSVIKCINLKQRSITFHQVKKCKHNCGKRAAIYKTEYMAKIKV